MDEGHQGGSLIQTLIRLLPILMIGMILMGMVMFAVTQIVPAWKTYETTRTELEAGQATVEQILSQSNEGDAEVLVYQIESAKTDLANSATVFMTADQADAVLDTLYTYADNAGVQITSLQAQQSVPVQPTSPPQQSGRNRNSDPTPALLAPQVDVYNVHAFRLTVNGGVVNLMHFVTQIREATVPGFVITNFSLKAGLEPTTSILTMDMLIYSSQYASGDAFLELPEVALLPTMVVTHTAPLEVTNLPGGLADTVGATQVSIIPEPPLTLVLNDGFDSGDVTHWELGAGWSLINDEGGKALEATNSPGKVTLIYNTLQDVAVQARFFLDTGSAQLTVRETATGQYGVTLDSLGLVALYRGTDLVRTAFTAPSGVARWRTLRLSVVQGIVRVSVDDVELIAISDIAEYPPGKVSIGMAGTGTIRVDDIEVWALDRERG
jgi:hypothetical protein